MILTSLQVHAMHILSVLDPCTYIFTLSCDGEISSFAQSVVPLPAFRSLSLFQSSVFSCCLRMSHTVPRSSLEASQTSSCRHDSVDSSSNSRTSEPRLTAILSLCPQSMHEHISHGVENWP